MEIPTKKQRVFTIDYEAFYINKTAATVSDKFSVTTNGNRAYIYDDRFDAYMLSIVELFVDDPFMWVGHPEDDDCPYEVLDGAWVWVANLGFDLTIFRRHQELGIIHDSVQPARWSCMLNMARYFRLPGNLAGAVLEGLGIEASKNMRSYADGKTWDDIIADDKAGEMLEYCLDDSINAGKFVEKFAPDWPEQEDLVSTLTVESTLYGFEMDWVAVEKAIKKLKRCVYKYEQSLPWVADGGKPLSPKGLAEACRDVGIEPPKSMDKSKPYIEPWLEEYGKKYPWVANMAKLRSANGLLKKVQVFADRRVGDEPRVEFGLKYCAAHTKRWGGDTKTNVQALHKDPVEGIHMRHLIVAPKGKEFFIPDYSQIEPRILAWLVGDQEFLDLLHAGWNPYEAHAKLHMGFNGKKGEFKANNKRGYFLAKQRVLGLGYGCGWVKLKATCAQYGMPIEAKEAKAVVRDFKESNTLITEFWDMLERDFKRSRRSNYDIELPSGNTLEYFNVQLKSRRALAQLEKPNGPHKDFWGGKLCENVCQAISRDIMRDALINLDAAGHRVLWHVHDEIILEIDKGSGAEKDITRIMQQTPDWIEGCPIEVDGALHPHYVKD